MLCKGFNVKPFEILCFILNFLKVYSLIILYLHLIHIFHLYFISYVQNGGVYISFLTTIFLGVLSAYTLLLLVDSSTMSSVLIIAAEEERKELNNIDMMNNMDNDTYNSSTMKNKKNNQINIDNTNSFNSNDNSNITTKTNSYLESGLRSNYIYEHIDQTTTMPSPVNIIPLATIPVNIPKKKLDSTYPEMAAVAFPEVTFIFQRRKYNFAYFVVSCGILLTSLGVCAAYIDFISETLPAILRNWTNNKHFFVTRGNILFISILTIFSSMEGHTFAFIHVFTHLEMHITFLSKLKFHIFYHILILSYLFY